MKSLIGTLVAAILVFISGIIDRNIEITDDISKISNLDEISVAGDGTGTCITRSKV